jgi:hypothetical protein
MKFANRYKAGALGCAGCEPLYDCDPPAPAVFAPGELHPSAFAIGRQFAPTVPQLRGLGQLGATEYGGTKKAIVGLVLFGGTAWALASYTKTGKKMLGKPVPAGLLGAALGAALGPFIY